MGVSLVVFLRGIRTVRRVLADMLRRTYAADYTPAVPSITTRLGHEIRRLRAKGLTVPAIAQELGVSEASVWRALRKVSVQGPGITDV
jgi:DNA-binding NarL/FixJ family response regulator